MEGEIITIETAQKLSEYDKLEKQAKKQKEVIDKAIEYIENNTYFKDNLVKTMIFKDFSIKLLDILREGKNE